MEKIIDKMDKIAVEVTAPYAKVNPMYSHVILGNAGDGEYFTRVGGYTADGEWVEFSGHYNMTVKEALKDLSKRVARGY
jgi:hypothetical protein